ncbi:MAG TPA: hypothetical protein DCX32_04990 [Candidatus Moranbacteria bacterium]|nr:MAG: hypothetical protein UW87_C0017G0004 [Candidatus Moranbacteria bacterium GW2011_GWC2_45_10]KKT95457.1 MAG: hypothetical protein UW95_C0001G0021 [Parcubacteria group bacterium GW2011_GWC1_45_14]HAV11863.1 hypothetical protein [Candidatus Moranbacteria bacterium]
MFRSSRKNKNKKELEYKKMRSVSKKEEGFRLLRSAYRILFYFLLAMFVAVSFYVVIFSPFLAVEKVKIEGTRKLGSVEVLAAASAVYDGRYLGIFPKDNFLLFPKRAVIKKLEDDFKRIRTVEVKKTFPSGALIRVEERESLLLWCDTSGECFIIDENGFAYHKVGLDSREVLENNLMRVLGQDDRKVSEGEKVLDAEKVSFLMDAKDVMEKSADMRIVGEARAKSRIAEEVTLRSLEGWDILVSTSFPLERAGNFLKLFLDKEISSEDRGKLEYVDLRVENRIYYKLKKEEEQKESENKEGENGGERQDAENKNE